MYHLAIMKKSWGLIPKILSGEKKIESRWYRARSAPWGKIKKGDTVYFKNSGEPVAVRAEVEKVLQFSDLNRQKVREVLDQYGKEDGLEKKDIPNFFQRFKDKKYCLLVFLKNPKKIKPFTIDKTGFGSMAAWLVVNRVDEVRRRFFPYSSAKKYLGKIVEIIINRPLGTKHPKYGDIYPVNYGYVPGTKAPDGKELDAYYLGVEKPLKMVKGKCIAIVHRLDDNEDKLIVVPPKVKKMTTKEISQAIHFQEQFFKYKILRN